MKLEKGKLKGTKLLVVSVVEEYFRKKKKWSEAFNLSAN